MRTQDEIYVKLVELSETDVLGFKTEILHKFADKDTILKFRDTFDLQEKPKLASAWEPFEITDEEVWLRIDVEVELLYRRIDKGSNAGITRCLQHLKILAWLSCDDGLQAILENMKDPVEVVRYIDGKSNDG